MDKPAAATGAPGSRDVEAIIARHVARRAVWVAPVLIALFGLIGGVDGAVAAAIGVGVVVANFLVSGAMQINARVPRFVVPGPAVPIEVIVGETTSASGVTVAVR